MSMAQLKQNTCEKIKEKKNQIHVEYEILQIKYLLSIEHFCSFSFVKMKRWKINKTLLKWNTIGKSFKWKERIDFQMEKPDEAKSFAHFSNVRPFSQLPVIG